MAVILNIETSAETCSVALTEEGVLLHQLIEEEPMKHSERLAPFISEIMDEAARKEKKIDAVAVSLGPGSYTGLRIGLSTAKGICFGLGVPLIGVPTLQAIAVKAMFCPRMWEGDELLMPMVDARRMEVYTGAYNFALEEVVKPGAMILDEHSLDILPADKDVYLFGSGAAKAKEVLARPRTYWLDIKPLLASDLLALSERAFRQGDFLDVAYSTPSYLKEVHTTTPKSKF